MFLPLSLLNLLRLSSGHSARLGFFSLLALLFYIPQIYALPTETLPEGLRSPSLRFGLITSLDQRYSNQGQLNRLKDSKSIEFDSETLTKFNARAEQLIETLNRFGLYKAGDLFNLGTLEINTQPVINYTAPVFAYGLTSQWTIALGLPVIQYTNDIQLKQTFSNLDYYNQFRGLSAELDQALDTDLAFETQKVIQEKGYKPLTSRNQKFLGDTQVVSLMKIPENSYQWILQTTAVLPTGPAYDPDDLVALNTFHEFSIEQTTGLTWLAQPWLEIAPFVSAKYFIPMTKVVRVPKNNDDLLPDSDNKDTLTESKGFSEEVGVQVGWLISDAINLKGLFQTGQQNSTRFSGSSKGDSMLLEKNTDSQWQKVRIDFNYSTVTNYLSRRSGLPMILTLSLFDTIKGKNIERRLGQELNLTLFF